MSLEIKGIVPIIAAPFTDSGAVDYESLRSELKYMKDVGCDGATLFGIAGEYYKLTDAECVACKALLGETYDAYTGYRDTLVLNDVIMKNEENLLAVGGQAQHINQLNSDIDEFYHSISYRTGRAVTAPARAAANLAKRVLHAARRG